MFSITPQLLPRETNDCKPPLGWFVPGTNISQWIRAINAFTSRRSGERFFVVPQSLSDRSAIGLVCLAERFDDKLNTTEGNDVAGIVPLRRIRTDIGNSDRSLWVPRDGDVSPNAAVEPLLAGSGDGDYVQFVWLPSCDLVRFDTEDSVTASDFLKRPPQRAKRTWDAPPHATVLPQRIVDIRLLNPPQLDQMFQQERNSIGGNGSSLMDLNDDGSTDQSGLKGWMRQKFNDWLEQNEERRRREQGQQVPDSAARRGQGSRGPSKLGQFLSQKLQSQRDKQIEKLLNLMKKDPDRALQFAIPMNGDSTFRGTANAGGNLTRRSTDFSLSGLFGGNQAADIWDLDAQLRAKLNASYREQAAREVAVGRFRRAAYIHAHLLGDYTSAAELLEKGGHFSEAAVLYGEHLHRRHDQARCLANSGQSGEAADLYQQLNEYEKAAEVWESIGDTERAVEVYEIAVKERIRNRQVLNAAQLVREKLNQPELAEELLWDQWPNGSQPLECANAAFELCSGSDRHDFAAEQFDAMQQSAFGKHDLLLARLSAALVRDYPDPNLKRIAEDRCRLAATNNIRNVATTQVEERMEAIRSINQSEKILASDLRRFQKNERQRSVGLQDPFDRQDKRKALTPIDSLRLAPAKYCSMEVIKNEIFAVGHGSQQSIMLVRAGNLTGEKIQCQTVETKGSLGDDLIGCSHVSKSSGVEIHLESPSSSRLVIPTAELVPVSDCSLTWTVSGNHIGGLTRFGGENCRWILTSDSMELRVYNHGNLETYDLSSVYQRTVAGWSDSLFSLKGIDPSNVLMRIVGNVPVIAFDQVVLSKQGDGFVEVTVLDGGPFFMASSLPYTLPRVLVSTPQFLKVISLTRNFEEKIVCSQGGYTHGCFLYGGRIAVVNDKHLSLFDRNRKSMRLACQEEIRSIGVVGVFPIGTNHIGVLYQNGILDRFRIER